MGKHGRELGPSTITYLSNGSHEKFSMIFLLLPLIINGIYTLYLILFNIFYHDEKASGTKLLRCEPSIGCFLAIEKWCSLSGRNGVKNEVSIRDLHCSMTHLLIKVNTCGSQMNPCFKTFTLEALLDLLTSRTSTNPTPVALKKKSCNSLPWRADKIGKAHHTKCSDVLISPIYPSNASKILFAGQLLFLQSLRFSLNIRPLSLTLCLPDKCFPCRTYSSTLPM